MLAGESPVIPGKRSRSTLTDANRLLGVDLAVPHPPQASQRRIADGVAERVRGLRPVDPYRLGQLNSHPSLVRVTPIGSSRTLAGQSTDLAVTASSPTE